MCKLYGSLCTHKAIPNAKRIAWMLLRAANPGCGCDLRIDVWRRHFLFVLPHIKRPGHSIHVNRFITFNGRHFGEMVRNHLRIRKKKKNIQRWRSREIARVKSIMFSCHVNDARHRRRRRQHIEHIEFEYVTCQERICVTVKYVTHRRMATYIWFHSIIKVSSQCAGEWTERACR